MHTNCSIFRENVIFNFHANHFDSLMKDYSSCFSKIFIDVRGIQENFTVFMNEKEGIFYVKNAQNSPIKSDYLKTVHNLASKN